MIPFAAQDPAGPTGQLDITRRILAFLDEIGISIEHRTIEEKTFLPGILIAHGTLVVDSQKMLYPGDLLHEAGHIAMMPAAERGTVYNTVIRKESSPDTDAMEEMGAIAWSYAASVHLQLPPQVVFHPDGYKGESESLADNFSTGQYFGVPPLNWLGMCNYGKVFHTEDPPYPYMIKWLRD
jgi:hypothetical protein